MEILKEFLDYIVQVFYQLYHYQTHLLSSCSTDISEGKSKDI